MHGERRSPSDAHEYEPEPCESAADGSTVQEGSDCFRIVTSDGSLNIYTEQMDQLTESNEYFAAVIAHETLEASSRVLSKPDWDIATARKVVELITSGKTCATIDNTPDVLAALDRVLEEVTVRALPWTDAIEDSSVADFLKAATDALNGVSLEIIFNANYGLPR